MKWQWNFAYRVFLKNRCVLQDSLSAVQFRNDLTRDFNVKLFSAKNCFVEFYPWSNMWKAFLDPFGWFSMVFLFKMTVPFGSLDQYEFNAG